MTPHDLFLIDHGAIGVLRQVGHQRVQVHHVRFAGAALDAYVMACYLDAAVFAVHGNIPSLVYGPITENIHGIDERVSLSSLKRVTKTLALFAADWYGVQEG